MFFYSKYYKIGHFCFILFIDYTMIARDEMTDLRGHPRIITSMLGRCANCMLPE